METEHEQGEWVSAFDAAIRGLAKVGVNLQEQVESDGGNEEDE